MYIDGCVFFACIYVHKLLRTDMTEPQIPELLLTDGTSREDRPFDRIAGQLDLSAR